MKKPANEKNDYLWSPDSCKIKNSEIWDLKKQFLTDILHDFPSITLNVIKIDLLSLDKLICEDSIENFKYPLSL